MLKEAIRTLIRLPLMLAVAAFVLLAIAFLLDTARGEVAVDWLGYNFSVRPGFLLVSLIAMMLAFAFGGAIWARVRGLPQKWRAKRAIVGLEELLAAAVQAIAAKASDNPKGFQKAVAKARKTAPRAELTRLLDAYQSTSRKKWRGLLGDKSLSLSARRYLANLALADGKTSQAADYAEDANDDDPEWAAAMTAICTALDGDWQAAETPAKKSKDHILQATIATQRSLNVEGGEAIEFAKRALATKADFIPAVLRLHKLLPPTAADALILKAWKIRPHPALLSAASERLVDKLAKFHPTNPLSQTAAALSALGRNEVEKAERILAPISGSAAAVQVMERVYRHQGKIAEADAIEATMPADNHLKCKKCDATMGEWQAVCPRCRSFGQIDWCY